ncbi:hypothetical protein ACTWM0_04280 [Pseudomonas machongensis]
MKVVEPLSSALLITACVYVAGISQYSELMRFFGVNPAFSQPAIDKIFYDGGLITFEVFMGHLWFFVVCVLIAAIIVVCIVFLRSYGDKTIRVYYFSVVCQSLRRISEFLDGCSGLVVFIYLIFLTFASYEKAKIDGEKVGQSFISVCHAVELRKDGKTLKGCAFSKDRDAIWFYSIDDGDLKAKSKPLSELDQITYFDPVAN